MKHTFYYKPSSEGYAIWEENYFESIDDTLNKMDSFPDIEKMLEKFKA
jgi:hypothetical protein